jgi:predicted membrane channel-forming protein YqfA (hemolysin III family)
MNNDESKSDNVSSAVAIFAIVVLGGLLAVPIMFILYGAGGGLGGLMILSVLILCQLAVYSVGSRIYRMFFRHNM